MFWSAGNIEAGRNTGHRYSGALSFLGAWMTVMIDRDFERRLEAWGAYYRRRYSKGRSPIADVCEQLAVAHGRPIHDGYREVSARPEINEADAQLIERCWCSLTDADMSEQMRSLLKAHYVLGKDMRITCRVLRIRFRSYETVLAEAVNCFQAAVGRMRSGASKVGPVMHA